MAFSPYSTWTPKLTASSPLHTSSSPTLREEIQPTTPKSPSMENVSNFNDRFRSWSTVNATKSGNGFTSLKSEDPISVPPRKPVSSVHSRCLSLVGYLPGVAAADTRPKEAFHVLLHNLPSSPHRSSWSDLLRLFTSQDIYDRCVFISVAET